MEYPRGYLHGNSTLTTVYSSHLPTLLATKNSRRQPRPQNGNKPDLRMRSYTPLPTSNIIESARDNAHSSTVSGLPSQISWGVSFPHSVPFPG